MKIEIEVDIPDGYEATGEYRQPKSGDYWIDPKTDELARFPLYHAKDRRVILRKAWKPEPWMPKNGCRLKYRESTGAWEFVRPSSRSTYIYIDANELAEMFGHTFSPPPDQNRDYKL